VPSIFLGIAAFLLHILLSRLISTQREQIAVLKAFGYSNVAIGWHYLKFLLAIVSIGTLLGTGLGLWYGKAIVQNYTRFFSFPVLRYEASLWIVGGAIAISSGAAIIGALVAVRMAVSLPPAEAMRPEPPARFRATLVERLGFQRFPLPSGLNIINTGLP
jgi:putative ABC transport system permease protein